MKIKTSLAVCTAALFIAFPLAAQTANSNGNSGGNGNGNGGGNGNGHGDHGNHGNNSNHSGHDDDGNSAGHRKDAPHGFGDRNLVLANRTSAAAVAGAMSSVTFALKSGSMQSTNGTTIPATAQR